MGRWDDHDKAEQCGLERESPPVAVAVTATGVMLRATFVIEEARCTHRQGHKAHKSYPPWKIF